MSRLSPKRLGAPYGGLNTALADWVIDDNVFRKSQNFVLRNNCLETSLGWNKLTEQVIEEGDVGETILVPLHIQQFFKSDGDTDLLLFTNKRAYIFNVALNLWIPITQGSTPITTTLTAGVAVNDVTINVVDTTGLSVGEQIILGFGTATAEYLVIDALTATTIDVSRPSWAPPGVGAQFIHANGDDVNGLASMVYDETTVFDVTSSNDVVYFTDGINPVSKYESGDTFHIPLPGLQTGDSVQGVGVLTSPLKARMIRVFSDFLVIGYLTENGTLQPNKIRWSQINEFEIWENNLDGTGQAGAFRFNTPDFIVRLEQLKRELFIYRERSIEAISYIGLPDIFAFRRTETRTGLLSTDALINRVDIHAFVGNENVWVNNGLGFENIGEPIKLEFFKDVTPNMAQYVELFYIQDYDEFWMAYSSDGERTYNKAYIFNLTLKKWSGPRTVQGTTFGKFQRTQERIWDTTPGTWDSQGSWFWNERFFLSTFPSNLMADDNGIVYVLEQGNQLDGEDFTKRYESKFIDCGTGQLLKSVQRIRVGADPTYTADIDIYIGTGMSEMDPVVWNGPFTINLAAQYDPYVFPDVYGRYFKVAIETTGRTTLQDVEISYYVRENV